MVRFKSFIHPVATTSYIDWNRTNHTAATLPPNTRLANTLRPAGRLPEPEPLYRSSVSVREDGTVAGGSADDGAVKKCGYQP